MNLLSSITVAMRAQVRWEVLSSQEVFYLGAALMVLGSVLVVTSFLALGFTGTFLGECGTQTQKETHTKSKEQKHNVIQNTG